MKIIIIMVSVLLLILATTAFTWYTEPTIDSVTLHNGNTLEVIYRRPALIRYSDGGSPPDDLWKDVYISRNDSIIFLTRLGVTYKDTTYSKEIHQLIPAFDDTLLVGTELFFNLN